MFRKRSPPATVQLERGQITKRKFFKRISRIAKTGKAGAVLEILSQPKIAIPVQGSYRESAALTVHIPDQSQRALAARLVKIPQKRKRLLDRAANLYGCLCVLSIPAVPAAALIYPSVLAVMVAMAGSGALIASSLKLSHSLERFHRRRLGQERKVALGLLASPDLSEGARAELCSMVKQQP